MWLDRFSNQSTPTGSSTPARTFSPAPSRTNSSLTPRRNGSALAPNRSTSSLNLSLSPASSDVSLPLQTKATNGSLLRYEQKPPIDVPDPLVTLQSVLRSSRKRLTNTTQSKHVEVIVGVAEDDIDFGDLSLQDFAVRPLHTALSRPGFANTRVADATATRQHYQNFHNSVKECDEVLESVQSYLTSFKAELGQVSAEIESLQARSIRLNAQLDNRRRVEKLLGPAVEELSLSPATVKSIAEGPIDEVFGRALVEVEARHLAIFTKPKEDGSNRALDDIRPLLEDLKARAIERIRDYLVSQIKALRSPNINSQIIQRQAFLRHKDLYPFLSRNHPALTEEITRAYVNTMKWYFNSHFTRYRTALDKLHLFPSDQTDLLGIDPATKKNGLSGPKGSHSQHDAFGLGRRGEILKLKNDAAIPSHVAEDSKAVHHLETPFWSFNQAMIDNASAEYSICTEFFSTATYQQVSRSVSEILEPTFNLGHELTKALVETSTDCLGILICVRLNQHFAREAQRRKVPILDSYINYTNILLWPRFQKIMDMHCESLKRVQSTSNRGAVAAFSLVGGTDASKASVAPSAITQRFAQFLHGILALSAESGDDEPVANSLSRLRGEYETLIGKLAKGAGDAQKRSRYLYNNYSLVLTIIGDAHGRLAEEQKEHFSMLIKDFKAR